MSEAAESRASKRTARKIYLKQMLMQQCNGRCHWCDKPVHIVMRKKGDGLPHDGATVDHVYPRNDPRRQEFAFQKSVITLVLSCYRCNTTRGDTPYDDFLKVMRPEWAHA